MLVVTGAAGFIGSNLVRALNERGRTDVLAVDDLRQGQKFENLLDCQIHDLLEPDELLDWLAGRPDSEVEAVLHQGACADTTEWDGRYMLRQNYDYSKRLHSLCDAQRIPFLYASSAAVYGTSAECRVAPECERPLNVYAWSKLLFDRYLQQRWSSLHSPVSGLRYFNVYGPGEQHKGEMASIVYKQHAQLRASEPVRLFGAYGGFGPGEQQRDFVWVGDVVRVNLFLLDHPEISGIFNVGTGRAASFNQVARAAMAYLGAGEIEYIDFPASLVGRYQCFTQADVAPLRAAGYDAAFLGVEEGVPMYLKWLEDRAA